LTKWDDLKKKIRHLEGDPFLDADMLKTLDSVSIADYWRRRFEEEHVLYERRLQAKDQEALQLKEGAERKEVELKINTERLEAARSQLLDRQRFWEERHHALEAQVQSLKDRMEWEIKSRVLEEKNALLAEQIQRRAENRGETAEAARAEAARAQAAREAALQSRVDALEGESRKAAEFAARLESAREDAARLAEEKKRWEEERVALRKELDDARRALKDAARPAADAERRSRWQEARAADAWRWFAVWTESFARQFQHQTAIISGTLQMCLTNGKLPEDVATALRGLSDVESRLSRLAQDLPSSENPEFVSHAGDLTEALEASLKSLVEKAAAAKITFERRFAEAPLPPALFSPAGLDAVLSALFENARDAMPRGGKWTVTTGADAAAGEAFIRLEDNGRGFEAAVLEKDLAPFMTTKPGRRGLSLSLCRHILGRTNGRLAAENVAGGGARVTLFFPIHP